MKGASGQAFTTPAELTRYPAPGFQDRLAAGGSRLAGEGPEAEAAFSAFAEAAARLSGGELEELYTRSFDMNPACALELGWHLYGERYERGAFLVDMRRRLAEHGIAETRDLPDHLSHALELLGRMGDDEAGPFAREKVLPAVRKLTGALKGKDEPYHSALLAVEAVLTRRFEPPARAAGGQR